MPFLTRRTVVERHPRLDRHHQHVGVTARGRISKARNRSKISTAPSGQRAEIEGFDKTRG